MPTKTSEELLRKLKQDVKGFATRVNKVNDNQIIFLNFTGNYDCNLKAIAEEIIKQKLDITLYWAIFPETDLSIFPKEIIPVIRGSREFYIAMATSKVIIDNEVATAHLGYKKKDDQYLIETWHGSIGIKRFGIHANDDTHWHKLAKKEAKMTDFVISNSDFENEVYRLTFWEGVPVWKFGHPRNDILFEKDEVKIARIRKSIYEKYNIPLDKKLCLYAPTFRDSEDLSLYKIDYVAIKEALEKRFGGEWVILTRFHNVTKQYLDDFDISKHTIDASNYPDIQELLLVIDCGITDYSSWICEYALRRKAGFLFAPDYEQYTTQERKLFLDLNELPFMVSTSIDDLVRNILNFDELVYTNKCDQFLSKYGSIDDGHASERTVKELVKIMELDRGK